MWQYYQSYYIVNGEDYEDKNAPLSTPTKLGVGLITKTAFLKPQQSTLRLHNAFMMGWFIVLCCGYCHSDTGFKEWRSNRLFYWEAISSRDQWGWLTWYSMLCKRGIDSNTQTTGCRCFFQIICKFIADFPQLMWWDFFIWPLTSDLHQMRVGSGTAALHD